MSGSGLIMSLLTNWGDTLITFYPLLFKISKAPKWEYERWIWIWKLTVPLEMITRLRIVGRQMRLHQTRDNTFSRPNAMNKNELKKNKNKILLQF